MGSHFRKANPIVIVVAMTFADRAVADLPLCPGGKTLCAGSCRYLDECPAPKPPAAIPRTPEPSGRPATPRFVDNEDGTVTDMKYRAVWSKRAFGPTNWEDAIEYCRRNKARLPGSGWHLPTIDELRTLILDCPSTGPGGRCYERFLDACKSEGPWTCIAIDWCHIDEAFVYPCEVYWSSTPIPSSSSAFVVDFGHWYGVTTPGDSRPQSSSSAFVVDFGHGSVDSANIGDDHLFRCVRAKSRPRRFEGL